MRIPSRTRVPRMIAGAVLSIALGAAGGRAVALPGQAVPDGATEAAPGAVERSLRFNFKNATIDQVLDWFSRETGLPIVKEADVPDGKIDYLSPESYTVPEALRVLNILLQSRGIMLRPSRDMLYLQKMENMNREAVGVYVGTFPDDVPDEEIVTFVLPLNVASAVTLQEKLAEMVASYGSVQALSQQNAIVITETAAQVRRLVKILEQLDREDPEGIIEIVKIRYVKASVIMEPLKALLAEKVEKYVVDAKGKQVKIDEETMPGLNITVDDRTNSIVAKGVQSRIDKLKEVIGILDVPDGSGIGQRTMRTLTLLTLVPSQAVQRLDQLFARVPEAERPTVVALDEVGKITIVGTETQITEGAALIREIDGGGPSTGDEATGITVFTLEHAAPDAVIAAVKGLLNRRQAQTLKLLASPDGRSLVVSGPAADVAAVSALLPSLDASRPVDREVRLVQIDARDPADVLERARRLYDRQVDAGDPQFALVSEFDDASRTITLIGPRPALDRFTSTLRTVESGLIVERETRQLELVNATPSEVASALTTLAAPLLAPTDGTRYVAPTVQPIDALDLLLVTALPEQFGTLLSIVKTLDRSGPNDFQFRVVTLAGVTNVDLLLTKASDVFARRTRGYPAGEITAPEVEFDPLTGNLMLTGETRSVQEYETALAEARRLLPPAREGRMIPLSVAKASDIVASLRELLAKTALVDPARTVPAPTIEAVERTNSLYVVAEPAQHQMIERTIALLDVIEPTDLPPLRLIQVRAADATQLADLLRRRYNARPNDQRREKPVDIDADPGTNALIVTAHEDVFEEVRTFVEGVNRAGDTRAERETMLFPLKRARAQDLAQAMDRLYPQPPMPLDARGRPLPHLQQPKEVQVSAEPATNTLIVEAPAERRAQFTALVEQLDRVELPPQAELRTYRIRRGDPTMIAQTLSDLARRGVLSAPPLDGGKPVDVTVQAEPLSRTLIVAGDAATFEKVEQMLVEIGNVPVERSLRVFEVNGVDARDLAARAQRLYAEQTAELFDAGAVSVEVDTDGSTVLVVADDEAMIRFAAILTELQNAVGPPPDVRLVALEDADATEVVAFLESMATNDLALAGMRGGAKPVFQAITRTNSVLVSAQPEQHSVIRSLISSFDVPEPQAMPPLRILQLRSADANNLATALTRQYGQRPSEERRDKPVSIAADPNTNTLMVAAHPDVLPEIQAIVEELNDTTRVGAEGREIRIFPLKVARAEELAKTIDEMFPEPPMPVDRRGQPLPHLRESREIVVRADVQTNALIVDAPVQRMVGFETLVEQLDRQRIVDETEVRTYRVVHADVDGLAGTLNRLAQTGALNPAGNDRRIAITITAEPVSQTLLVSGPTAIFDRVEQVLEDLDVRRMAPATTLKFFKLRFARAESLAPMLREILTARIAEDVPEAGANIASLLNVSAETKTNTLIISAPETVMPVVDALIAQLDDQSASLSDPVIRVRPLNFADPADVSQSLVQALPNMVSPVTGEPMNVKLIPSPGSNAIIMVGVAGELDEVETLIEPLDARPSMDAVGAKTFTLEHADAAVVAPIVQRLLTDQQATDPMIVRERIRRSRGPIDLVAPIRVEADARTNTLIVSGPQRTVGLAEALITQLDAPDESANRTYATYTPVNAGAAAMVPSVKRVIESTRPNGRRSTLEIMLEPQSGAIVVIGSASDTEQAVELLRRWDDEALTPPQMDFRMVTLTHSDASVVAQALGPMLRDRSRWPQALRAAMQAGLAVSEPTVTADPRANRVLVTAPQDLMAVASAMITELDQPRPNAGAMDMRIFSLRQADANDVATAVSTSLAARAAARPGEPAPSVVAESSSNSLIVTATAATLAEVETMIAALDEGSPTSQPQVRTVFLRHARADLVAPIIEDLLGVEEDPIDPNRLPSWMMFDYLQMRRQATSDGPPVRVIADTRLNAVVVAAPVALLDVAEQMIAQIDVDASDVTNAAARSVRVLVLANADATEIAATIDGLFADPDATETAPVVRVESSSNALIIRATASQFETIAGIVDAIDDATVASSRQMRMIPIDPARADAAEIARTLERLLDRGRPGTVEVITIDDLLKRRREAPARPKQSSRLDGNGDGDGRGRGAASLLGYFAVAAPGEIPEPTPAMRAWAHRHLAARRVETPAVAAPVETPVAPPIVAAPVRDAAPAREAIESEMRITTIPVTMPPEAPMRGAAPTVEAPADVAIELPVVVTAAAPGAEAPATRAAETDAAVASALDAIAARMIDAHAQAMESRTETGSRRDATPAATAPSAPAPPTPRTAPSAGPVPAPVVARPAAIEMSALDLEAVRDAVRADSDITIAVDPATNALIVVGSPRALERIAGLAAQLQDQLPAQPGTVRYIALPTAVDADTVRDLVEATLRQMSGGRQGMASRVSVLADDLNNALVVVSNAIDFETVGDLVAALSNPPRMDEMIVKVYPLTMITAERAAESVRTLVSGGVSERDRRRNRQADRMRELALRLMAGGDSIEAVFDPNRVSVASDAQTNSIIVMGPTGAVGFIDRFVELLDQAPVNAQATLKTFALHHATASDLRETLRDMFRARFRSMRDRLGPGAIEPDFGADDRTNTLLVTASPEQLAEVETLIAQLDVSPGEERFALRMIELQAARPTQAAEILRQVVLGTDQKRRTSTLIVPSDDSGVLMVRASDAVYAEIESVLREIDRTPTSTFKVRTLTLERADATMVAQAIQKFYDDRAKIASTGRGRREQGRRISIVGDTNSNTLLVAAADEDFEEIRDLITRFDSEEANRSLEYRVFTLRHAKATEIESTVNDLINDLTWNQPFFWDGRGGGGGSTRDKFAIRADERLNALIVTGEGDKFDVVQQMIDLLDAPPSADRMKVVRVYPIQHADVDVVRQVVEQSFNDAQSRIPWWRRGNETGDVQVIVNAPTRTLIVRAAEARQTDIAALIESVDSSIAMPGHETQVVPVEFAEASELARSLTQFLEQRTKAGNATASTATIVASRSSNALLVSATPEDMALLRDLLSRMDQPEVAGDREIEIVLLRHADADEVSRIIGQQFPKSGGQGIIITPDIRTGSLIVNAPRQQFAQARALIERLDAPNASDETIIRIFELDAARAGDVVNLLRETLQLDASGETRGITIRLDDLDGPAVEVQAKIVADLRSNSLVVTATEESFPVIETLIRRVDSVPASNPVEYRIRPLEHAIAMDVSWTLEQFMRNSVQPGQPAPRIDYNRVENQLIIAATADQFEQIEKILAEIDVPSQNQRTTDFVPLQFADAAKIQEALAVFYGPTAIEADTPGKLNVRIVADPATNSLVISADENEWAGIRSLLGKLDSEEYDASLQLRVLPLVYADASSVAAALNEAFQSNGQDRNRRGRDTGRNAAPPPPNAGGDAADRRDSAAPTVLLQADEWVRASAEPITNSVIVSANRQNLLKIERIIEQLDVADYATLPPPQLIPVTRGNPGEIAEALRSLYDQQGGRDRGRKGLRIVADAASNTIIVRAEEDEFKQIRSLALALQQEFENQGLAVHVIRLVAAPAARVAEAIREAFGAKARQSNQPLSIEVDAAGNALIVACTLGLYDEIELVVQELDNLSPAAGQGIFIIELQNVAPEAVKSMIETIGLHQPARPDSTSRLVTEPIKVSVMPGRRAVMIVANPVDRDTLVTLVKSIDAEPALAEAQVRIVRLRNAEAAALVTMLEEVLDPARQQSQTALAMAIQEQVRRLSVRRDGVLDRPLALDLTVPIRLIADAGINAVVISSTAGNVAALEELVSMFDALPVTDAVTVQLFPLENIAASDFARIVREMFDAGAALGRTPGRDVQAVPSGTVGLALSEGVALSVDERTNTVIVAGKEEAVALVEVLSKRVDSDIAAGWVEPRVIALRFADATDLARTLDAILVQGAQDLPQANPLQRQIARLRMARGRQGGVIESDVFQPMTRFVIRAEPQLNALILVGTPVNLDLVGELVAMLDTEAASPSAVVRIYPVEHASATRVGETLTRLFAQQVDSKAIRPEDRVIVQADERTNALIVTTSPRSFVVFETLLETLDREVAPDLREIRRITVEHASASRLATLVQQMMDARLERLKRVQPETAELERATIIADARTNSLIVAAGNESYEVVSRLVADLDDVDLLDQALVHVVTVQKGNVERMADAVERIMERRYADVPDDVRQSQRPLVLTDPRTSSLLVAASPEDVAAIEALVARLEAAPMNPALALHVVPLSSGDPERLAPRLEQLMRQRAESLGDASTPLDDVSIEPDPASRSLIVASTEENLAVIRDLIGALARAESGVSPDEIEIIHLASQDTESVVEMVNELYVDEANRVRGRDAVRVTGDARLNAVLVSGTPADREAIRGLVEQIDQAKPANVVEIRYIPLASANAQETVGLIQAVLAGQGIERRFVRSDRAIVVKYMRKLAGGSGDDPTSLTESEMEVSSAIRSSITLTPDVRTNTVIVRAPSRAMKMIEQMIADLDDATTGAQSIRIFKLVNADSEAMAGILSELFSLRQQGSLYVLKPREGRPLGDGTGGTGGAGGAAAPAPGDFGSELTAVPDERQQLSITVDTRTNSLLVSGSPTYLDLVQDVVQRLDAEDANERNVEVYALRNAVAEDVASVIGDFVDAEQRKLVETLGSDQLGSASRLLEREVTIVGDAKSNTVLVSASPRYMDRVMEMVRKLDVDPPQVLIQVLLAEVTLDSGNDWGVDANVDFSVGGADGSAGFGFASAFVAGTGVPSLAIASQDFQLLVRALKTQGRMAVLSNPTIMAANNETARLQVGDEIQVPTGNTLNADGQATSVEPRQLGVILDVLPSINPDGFVRLVITPEISLLSNRTTQISENFEAPVITKRTATTTVTVKDGQTIVIGGLISDRYERRDRKVPLLGDIPLIGALFSSTTEEFAKTELLIVLTPHVIYSPSNIARVNQVTADEIDRLTVPEAIKQDIRESLINGTGGIYDAKGNRIDFGGDKADYRHDWSRWDERKEPGPDRLPVQRAPDPATPDPKPVATPDPKPVATPDPKPVATPGGS